MGSLRAQVEGLQAQLRAAQEAVAAAKSEVGTRAARGIRPSIAGMQLPACTIHRRAAPELELRIDI